MATAVTLFLHKSIAIAWALWIAVACQLAYWAYDRAAPFTLLESTTFAVAPGGTMLVNGTVFRDRTRDCNVTFNRYFTDSKGYRTDLAGAQYLTDQALDAMDDASPNQIKLSVQVPNNIAPGPAVFTTALAYICNPVQQFFPIPVLMNIPVQILRPLD